MISKISNNNFFVSIDQEQLAELDEIIDGYNYIEEEAKKVKVNYPIRFQDYYDSNLSYSENLEYFKQNFPSYDENYLYLFSKYILDKEFEDIKLILEEPEYGVDYLIELLEKKDMLENIAVIIDTLKSKTVDSEIDFSDATNLFVIPSYNSKILELLQKNSTGNEQLSINKAITAFKTLAHASFTDQEFSRKIHKVIDNSRKHDIKLTNYLLPMQRYSTGRSTKIVFFKLPLCNENREEIATKFGVKNLENIYCIAGYGNFKDSGYSENEFYRLFIELAYSNLDELQEISNCAFDHNKCDELANYLSDSKKTISSLNVGNIVGENLDVSKNP